LAALVGGGNALLLAERGVVALEDAVVAAVDPDVVHLDRGVELLVVSADLDSVTAVVLTVCTDDDVVVRDPGAVLQLGGLRLRVHRAIGQLDAVIRVEVPPAHHDASLLRM